MSSEIKNVFRFTKLTVFLKINFAMILSLFYIFFLCLPSGTGVEEGLSSGTGVKEGPPSGTEMKAGLPAGTNVKAGLHPIHISVTEINYNEKSKSLQITSRIFVDEMELGVRAQRKEPELDILEPKSNITTKQLINNYLMAHLKIKIDGKPAKINFLGFEKEDISFVSYLEVENVKKLKTIEVFNDIITEIHDDQSNLVHVTYKNPVKSTRLTRENTSEIFTFSTK